MNKTESAVDPAQNSVDESFLEFVGCKSPEEFEAVARTSVPPHGSWTVFLDNIYEV